MIIPLINGATGIVKKTFKENFGSHNKKTLNRFITKESILGNITHNTESTAI
jgi:hypothetical protein